MRVVRGALKIIGLVVVALGGALLGVVVTAIEYPKLVPMSPLCGSPSTGVIVDCAPPAAPGWALLISGVLGAGVFAVAAVVVVRPWRRRGWRWMS